MRVFLGGIFVAFFLVVQGAKKNVLFIISDDLRPQLDLYKEFNLGATYTPNLDDLAGKSLLVKRAYVQYGLCSPSRSSFLTGRRPDTTHVYDLQHYFRDVGGNFTTLPQYFKNHGYRSVGMGKIFHPGKAASNNDDPISWNEYYQEHVGGPGGPGGPGGHREQHRRDGQKRQNRPGGPGGAFWGAVHKVSWKAVSDAERLQDPLEDDKIAAQAKKSLNELSQGGEPFFLAVGFIKPHLPFVFPQKYLTEFPLSKIHLPTNAYAPIDMPRMAWNNMMELRDYQDISALNSTGQPNTTFPDNIVKDLRRAYFSAVSYMDDLVGDVLAELNKLNLMNDTIIIFIGDHGYNLGEHGLWGKSTNFEDALHAPMMIRVPGMTDQGAVTNELVEFVDLFPTIVEAAGLPEVPLCPEESSDVTVCAEGKSMLSLIKNPAAQWKTAAFSQTSVRNGNAMGYTVRTDKYRYTEWVHFNGAPIYKADMSKMVGRELYDHSQDMQENVNLADHPDMANIVASLKNTLHVGWRSVHADLIGK